MRPQPRNALVTGGTGFLGGRLARRLNAAGWRVSVLGRNEAAGRALAAANIRFIRADLADAAAVDEACRGQEIVFHSGARSSPWGRYADFYHDNVTGTESIVAACERWNVSRLIHVSTPSIYFDFTDRLNIPETQPPPTRPANHYVRTKLLAEAVVDAATARGLATITLRPRAIFGPGDTTLFPRLIRAHGSRGFPLIGPGDPLMDITFVENVVDALLLAADAPTDALDQKFNITNGEPWPRSRLLAALFAEIGRPLKTRPVDYRVAHCAAAVMENVSNVFTLGHWEPPLTRYTVGVLAKSQTLDISAARSVLGYQPRISICSTACASSARGGRRPAMRHELSLMSDGWCEQLEHIACRGGSFRRIRFASMFALIRHPQFGPVIFDTGYTARFFEETKHLPGKLYRWVTPVTLSQAGDVATQLRARGIAPEEVRHVIVSHFSRRPHRWSERFSERHVFIARGAAFESVKTLSGLRAVKHAYLPGLMPLDFPKRAKFIEDSPLVLLPANHAPFTQAHDVFGGRRHAGRVTCPAVRDGPVGGFFDYQRRNRLPARCGCLLVVSPVPGIFDAACHCPPAGGLGGV